MGSITTVVSQTLSDVVDHYNAILRLTLSEPDRFGAGGNREANRDRLDGRTRGVLGMR